MNIETRQFKTSAKELRLLSFRLWAPAIVGLSIVPTVLGVAFWVLPNPEPFMGVSLIVCGVVVVPLVYWVYMYWYYNHKENRSMPAPRYMVVADDHVESISDEAGQGRMPWKKVVRVHRVRSTTMLFLAKNLFYFGPHDAFESDAKLQEFFRLVELKTGAKIR